MISTQLRTLIPGSQWLYYKLFGSTQISNQVLKFLREKVISKLLAEQKITKWFFVRYNDPVDHLRIRYELSDLRYLGEIIHLMYSEIIHFVESKEIHNVQIDTYSRELERYGLINIEWSESLFFHNSEMVLHFLEMSRHSNIEVWHCCIALINNLLDDFHLNDNQKLDLFSFMSQTFGNEFGMNNEFRRVLDLKFRKERDVLSNLCHQNIGFMKNKSFLEQVALQRDVINKILQKNVTLLDDKNEMQNLISHYIHMCCNRLFDNKQRQQELVIYYLLSRHFESKNAQLKYNNPKKL